MMPKLDLNKPLRLRDNNREYKFRIVCMDMQMMQGKDALIVLADKSPNGEFIYLIDKETGTHIHGKPIWLENLPPEKVQGEAWMNVYVNGESFIHPTKEEAEARARSYRIACIHLKGEAEIQPPSE